MVIGKIVTWGRSCPTYFGAGALDVLGERAKELGMSKVLLVTEKILLDLKIVTRVLEKLEAAGIEVVLFDKVIGEPESTLINEGVAFFQANQGIDGIIGCGGGSSMDCAKAIALVSAKPGSVIEDYLGTLYNEGQSRVTPLILIPTTSGTGSEVTRYVVITDVRTGQKQTPLYAADLAIVDPSLTYTLPAEQTCATSLDALAHAIEGITSASPYNPYTYILAAETVGLVFKWLPIAVKELGNEKAREMLSIASNFAGLCVVETPPQFAHGFGECMGAMFHTPHGISCAWGLPAAMDLAAKANLEKAKFAAKSMGLEFDESIAPDELAKRMIGKIVRLMRNCNLKSLKAYGFSLEDCLSTAEHIFKGSTYNGGFFPKKLTLEEMEEYIKLCYEAYQ